MAHFAQVSETNTVTDVIVVNNETIENLPFPESEPIGQEFIASLGLPGLWLQTSYSNSFRGVYAGLGCHFDPTIGEYGEFINPAPLPGA